MKKTLKRILSVMLVIVLALSVAACGDSYELNSEAILKKIPSELKGTTIKFANWYNPDDRGEEGKVIDAFEEMTGIKVEVIQLPYATFVQDVAALVEAGNAPDVVRIKYPSPKRLEYLQPIEEATGFDFSSKAWDETIKNMYTYNGKCYAVNTVKTPFSSPSFLFYNTATMQARGYEDPFELWKKGEWTWEKFEAMCKDWVAQGDNYYGAYLNQPVTATTGNDIVMRKGNLVELDITNASAMKTWKYQEDGAANRIFAKDNKGFDENEQTKLFATSDATATQSWSGSFKKTRVKGTLACVPYPTNGNLDEYYLPMQENLGFGVCKGAKNAKAVPYFLAYILDIDNYNLEDKNFFENEQMKSCYLESLNITNRHNNYIDDVLTFSGEMKNVQYGLANRKSTEIDKYLQDNKDKLQKSVDEYNKAILAIN